MADNSLLQQAAQQTAQTQSEPSLLDSAGNLLSQAGQSVTNFFTPDPQVAAEEAEINRIAQEQGVDPQAIRMNLQNLKQQQQVQARETASQPPVSVNSNSQYSPDMFVQPEEQAAQTVPTVQVQQTPKGPSFESQVGRTFSAEQKAIKSAAEAGALKATEEAAFREQLGNELQASQAKIEQVRNEMKKRTDEEIGKFQEIQKQTSDFKFQDYWENKSEGQRVLAGIAIALGGIGAAYQGRSENKALDIINQAIDRDLKIQKMNFDKLKDQGEQSKSILGLMNQQFDNEVQAETATRALMLQNAQNELMKIASKYEAPELRAKADQTYAQLERQKVMYQEAFRQQSQQKQILAQVQGAANNGQMTPQQEAVYAKVDPEGYKVMKDRRERTVPGLGLALDPQAAKEARKIVGAKDTIVQSLKEMQKILKNAPIASRAVFFDKPLTNEAKDLQTLYGDMIAAYKDYKTLGTLDKGVELLMNKVVADPTTIVNPTDYNNTIQIIERGAKKNLKPLLEGQKDDEAEKKKVGFKPAK